MLTDTMQERSNSLLPVASVSCLLQAKKSIQNFECFYYLARSVLGKLNSVLVRLFKTCKCPRFTVPSTFLMYQCILKISICHNHVASNMHSSSQWICVNLKSTWWGLYLSPLTWNQESSVSQIIRIIIFFYTIEHCPALCHSKEPNAVAKFKKQLAQKNMK